MYFGKTKCLGSKNGSCLYLHDGRLRSEKQSSEKDLGVIIDNRLNVSCLGNAVAKRTNETLKGGGGGRWEYEAEIMKDSSISGQHCQDPY